MCLPVPVSHRLVCAAMLSSMPAVPGVADPCNGDDEIECFGEIRHDGTATSEDDPAGSLTAILLNKILNLRLSDGNICLCCLYILICYHGHLGPYVVTRHSPSKASDALETFTAQWVDSMFGSWNTAVERKLF